MDQEIIKEVWDLMMNSHRCDICFNEKLILKQEKKTSFLGTCVIYICRECEIKEEQKIKERDERLKKLFKLKKNNRN